MFPHHALVKKKLFFQTFVMTLIIKISPGNPSGLTENCTLRKGIMHFSVPGWWTRKGETSLLNVMGIFESFSFLFNARIPLIYSKQR